MKCFRITAPRNATKNQCKERIDSVDSCSILVFDFRLYLWKGFEFPLISALCLDNFLNPRIRLDNFA